MIAAEAAHSVSELLAREASFVAKTCDAHMSLELRLARTLLTHLVARRKLFGILARPDVNTRIGSTDDSGAQRV